MILRARHDFIAHHSTHLLEESDSAAFLLVGLDLAEGDARSIVDADVDELPADAAMVVWPSRSPVMVVDLIEFTELFDIDVKEFAAGECNGCELAVGLISPRHLIHRARPVLQALSDLGVSVRIVTGDNERVTRHVCMTLGIPIEGIINRPELAEPTGTLGPSRLRDRHPAR